MLLPARKRLNVHLRNSRLFGYVREEAAVRRHRELRGDDGCAQWREGAPRFRVDRSAQPFLRTPHEETAPKFSPDGEWLAYSSDETGRREIFVQPYPGPGGKWQISTDGGQEPVWNPRGGELFYRIGNKVMAVDIDDANSSFSAGKPRMLFEGSYLQTSASFPWWDVAPDGEYFLMLKPVETESAAPTQINVVLNFFEELKQKAPVK